MILVDTSVWVDHLRAGNKVLSGLLDAERVLIQPFIIGEIALGHLRQRQTVLDALLNLPSARLATDPEVLHFIDSHELFGRGIGYIDVHLLAAVRLTAGAEFWTNDTRLRGIARELGMAVAFP